MTNTPGARKTSVRQGGINERERANSSPRYPLVARTDRERQRKTPPSPAASKNGAGINRVRKQADPAAPAKSSRKEADILNSLEKVCIQFNNAYKKKNGSRAFYGEPVLEFDKKLADYTRQADVWDRDKMVRGNTVEKYLAAIKTEAGLP